mgnify:FL=1
MDLQQQTLALSLSLPIIITITKELIFTVTTAIAERQLNISTQHRFVCHLQSCNKVLQLHPRVHLFHQHLPCIHRYPSQHASGEPHHPTQVLFHHDILEYDGKLFQSYWNNIAHGTTCSHVLNIAWVRL